MAKDEQWHGIPRREIPWFPTIDAEKCIGCTLCFVTCGRLVFDMNESAHKAEVTKPYSCMVGCSTCAMVCPTEAISFPARELIWKVEREHKIFKIVRQEAKKKKVRLNVQQARKQAEERVSKLSPRVAFEVAGEFGEKRFLMQLYEFVHDKDADIVDVRFENPTLKGTIGGRAPAYMCFALVSESFGDIEQYVADLHVLIEKNELVLINEHKL